MDFSPLASDIGLDRVCTPEKTITDKICPHWMRQSHQTTPCPVLENMSESSVCRHKFGRDDNASRSALCSRSKLSSLHDWMLLA